MGETKASGEDGGASGRHGHVQTRWAIAAALGLMSSALVIVSSVVQTGVGDDDARNAATPGPAADGRHRAPTELAPGVTAPEPLRFLLRAPGGTGR